MTTEDVIEILDNERTPFVGRAIYTDGERREAFGIAIAALRAQQERENPKPLTLDKLREMAKEKPVVVWVVCVDQRTKEPDFEYGEWEMFDGYTFVAEGTEDSYRDYGETFVAYPHKPERADNT